MEALRIAFDAIIVGALALPWVVFATDLFFLKDPNDDNRVKVAFDFVTDPKKVPIAVAAVILFSVTYLLGSAISRTAQDFFNDDDLIHLWRIHESDHDLIHLWPTEDNIRTAQYCDQDQHIRGTFKEITSSKEIASSKEVASSKENTSSDFDNCPNAESKEPMGEKYSRGLVRETQWVFRLQEAQLLLKGGDRTERLRHQSDEIMVLRGAAFDGILGVVFCLFCWWARPRRSAEIQHPGWRNVGEGKGLRWALVVPSVLLLVGLRALYAHFQRSHIDQAPFMELTVIAIAVAGLCGLYKSESRQWYGHGLFLLMLLFFGVAYLAWWRTEVLYNDQVIYSYAQHHLLK